MGEGLGVPSTHHNSQKANISKDHHTYTSSKHHLFLWPICFARNREQHCSFLHKSIIIVTVGGLRLVRMLKQRKLEENWKIGYKHGCCWLPNKHHCLDWYYCLLRQRCFKKECINLLSHRLKWVLTLNTYNISIPLTSGCKIVPRRKHNKRVFSSTSNHKVPFCVLRVNYIELKSLRNKVNWHLKKIRKFFQFLWNTFQVICLVVFEGMRQKLFISFKSIKRPFKMTCCYYRENIVFNSFSFLTPTTVHLMGNNGKT